MSFEIEHRGREENWSTPQYRAALRDARLSWAARGLFAWLWDLPRGWVLRSLHLAEMGPDGKDAVRSRLRELENVGAVRKQAIRGDDGKVRGSRWIIVSPAMWAVEASLKPQKDLQGKGDTESRISRLSDFPTVEEPSPKVLQERKGLQERSSSKPLSVNNSRVRRQLRLSASGINLWTAEDEATAIHLENEHGIDVVRKAVQLAIELGNEPLPSTVQRMLAAMRAAELAEANSRANGVN